MNYLDVIAIAVILLCGLRCFFRGFIKEFTAFAAPLLGGVAAFLFWKPLSALGLRLWPALPASGVIAAVLLFLAGFLAMKILEQALSSLIERMSLGPLDRLLGFVIGSVEGILICALLLAIVRYQPIWDARGLLEGSFFWRVLAPFLPRLGVVPDKVPV
jgi:membrane protein required for colicin V production